MIYNSLHRRRILKKCITLESLEFLRLPSALHIQLHMLQLSYISLFGQNEEKKNKKVTGLTMSVELSHTSYSQVLSNYCLTCYPTIV